MAILGEVTNALLIGAAVANVLIGGVVLTRNSRLTLNRYFFSLSIGVAGWAITNILFRIVSNEHKLFFALLSYGFAALLAVFFFLFCSELSRHYKANLRSIIVFLGVSVALVSLIPGVIAFGITSSGVIEANMIPLLLYGTMLAGMIALGINALVRSLARSNKAENNQVKVVLFSLLVCATIGILCNLILPIYGNYEYVTVGPSGSLIFVFATAFAIVRHKMFDIRAVIARSLGYTLSVSVLSAIYGLFVFGIASYAFDLHISAVYQILLSLSTGLAGLIFQKPIKAFDRFTNKVFYRDAYDPQELFDQLNRTLVSSLELNFLLKHSSKILADNLKSEFTVVALKGSEFGDYRIIGTTKKVFDLTDIEKFRELTPKYHQTVIVADYLDGKYAEIKRLLRKNNISVLIRLASDASRDEEGLGYIALGPKKSGNPYNSQDIRVLDTVANELIIAIQNALHFEEIQRFNLTLQAKIAEATRQLQRTNSKLEALDETKDDFISMASHQLRTPLTSVKGYLSMVLDGDAGKVSETQRKMLSQAFISSQRMVYLIADLLNVSRLKTGKFIIDPSPTDLSKLITEEVSQLVETAESRELKLTYSKPASFPVLQLDETKTRQVIMNFIDNAIYYTPPGGHIDVQLIDKGVTIELRIVDDGIGVPSSEQYHLFTKFYRARNAQKARPDGTGLGLFMAKKVIAAQGGAIIFESKEGKGSTFGFSFSKARLENPTPVAVPIEPKVPAAVK